MGPVTVVRRERDEYDDAEELEKFATLFDDVGQNDDDDDDDDEKDDEEEE